MKGIAYLGDGAVELRNYADPTPGPGEALVRMQVAGLCGSDLHKYHKSRAWAAERNGMIAGHEPAGVIVDLGSGVEGLHVGDRVSVYHSLGCGHCRYCLAGTPVFCDQEGAFGRTRDGCFADLMTTPARYCLPLPEEFSFAVGAMLACTAGTAYAALSKVPCRHADTVVVFGLGPVGLSALLMAASMGFRSVGVDLSPSRLELARSLHPENILDAREEGVVEAVNQLTDGRGADGILECSGSGIARTQAVEALAVHGTIVIVGVGPDPMDVNPQKLVNKECMIRSNRVYSIPAYFEAVDFLRTHDVPLDDLVTHRFRIEDGAEAFALFDRGETGKVVFEWEDA